MAARRARVTAPYSTVRVMDAATGGPAMLSFYRDAVYPDGAAAEDVERQVRRGYAEWLDADEVPAVDAEPEAEPEAPKKAAAKKTTSA